MNLTDILQLLNGADPEYQDAITTEALQATKDMLWVPNPGPQTEAFFSEADEVFYGGQAGGGKTDLEIGLSLTGHTRSLLLRRTNKEALGLVERMAEIVGSRDGWSSQAGIWRLPSKATVEIGGVQLEEDKQKYKGSPHDLICVGRGTPVLMADGKYKPVESVQVGDHVATLEGARRVLRAFRVTDRKAVRVTTGGVDQIQSASHRLFTERGWLSSDDLYAPQTCSRPRVYRAAYRYYARVKQIFLEFAPRLLLCTFYQPRVGLSVRAILGLIHPRGPVSYGRPQDRGIFSGGSCVSSPGRPPLPLSFGLSRPRALRRAASETFACLRLAYHAVFGAHDALAPGDFPVGCRAEFRLRGERPPFLPGLLRVATDDPALFLPPAGAALPTPTGFARGGVGHTPTRTRPIHRYPHPYGKGTRSTAADLFSSPWAISDVVVDELFDLEVEEVNHFITFGGLINKNCFDEVSDFTESQYTFIITWNRSAVPGQRCRVLAAGNPPTRPEGLWVIKRWAAWLDPQHPRPANPGELRWYTAGPDGDEIEVDGPGPHLINGEQITARSRTFIPAELADNPDLVATDYASVLAALPPELRAAYRDGNFGTALRDDAYQTIPTQWIREAQARWKPQPPVGVPMCAIGVDVAQGGDDNTVLAPRYDGWYPPLITIPGKETPDGKAVAGHVVRHRRSDAKVIVDLGGGWGGDALAHMAANGIDAVGYMGVKKSMRRTQDGKIKFTNVRTEAYWRFREALDPSQEHGSPIALPQDAELVADLCAPKYSVGPNGLAVEPKETVVKRLGRSPDRGDAVVMAWYQGLKQVNIEGGWKGRKVTPKVITKRGR